MGNWCKHCGEYDVWGKGCICKPIGRVWRTDDDETESEEIWGRTYDSVADAVERWAKTKHNEDFDFMSCDEPTAFSFRPNSGGPVVYVTVIYELAPSFSSEQVDKDDDAVSEARSRRARTLRYRRKRALEAFSE